MFILIFIEMEADRQVTTYLRLGSISMENLWNIITIFHLLKQILRSETRNTKEDILNYLYLFKPVSTIQCTGAIMSLYHVNISSKCKKIYNSKNKNLTNKNNKNI